MKASLNSSGETGILSWSDLRGSEPIASAEATIAEEVRGFRAGIAQWAASYAQRRDPIAESADEHRVASASLRRWSREYFHAIIDRGSSPAMAPATGDSRRL